MKKLYYFIGPEKTGTTFIYELLNNNTPSLLLGTEKENFILSRCNNLKKELKNINSFEGKVLCQVEPSYFASPTAINSLETLSKDFEIVVVHSYRDPLERSISHYLHHRNKGRISCLKDIEKKFPEILNSSLYDNFIKKWKTLDIKFLVFPSEFIFENPREFLFQIGLKDFCPSDILYPGIVNERFRPKNLLIAKVLTKISDLFRAINFNYLHKTKLKKILKNIAFRGGKERGLNEVEKRFIMSSLKNLEVKR
jgi:hypothetical protein